MTSASDILNGYSAAAVKSIAQARGLDTKPTKAQLVHALGKILWDPKRIEQVLETLSPAQMGALQRAKQYGGQGLSPDLLQSQIEVDGDESAQKTINSLMRLGFLVYEVRGPWQWELWPTRTGYNYYYQPPTLRLAPPVAERVEVPRDLGRLPLEPWTDPVQNVLEGSFSTLQRDLYQFLQYLRENRVKLLKSGLLGKRDFSRII
jgi:hypothetical protein